jgi:hypothetical protein
VPRDLLTKTLGLAAVLVAGFVLALAGCGDENGGSGTTTRDTTTDETTTEDTTTGDTETDR